MIYYGTRLSENISRREPEGYLLCLNVPVARTGIQEYLPEELGLPPGPDPVPVSRTETEVFSPETVASFEGMPVTNNHPPDGVTIENIRALQKGHAHNVRRGSGEESDLLLADLIITDPGLIEAILGGKREISCGYMYELCEENGQYYQRKIRGNHVAVVDAGRAGPRVSIKDQKPSGSRSFFNPNNHERSTPNMKKSLLKKLTKMARDGDPEAIEALAEAVEEIIDPESAEAVVAVVADPEPAPATAEEVVVETPVAEVTVDEDPGVADIISRLDRIISLLTPAAPAADEDPAEDLPEELAEVVEEAVEAVMEGEAPAEETAEEVAAIVEEVIAEADPDASTVLEPEAEDECGDPDPIPTADAIRAALSAVRPALKKMSRRDRKRVCADIAARLQAGVKGPAAISALKDARCPQADMADLGKRIMESRNPNYKQ